MISLFELFHSYFDLSRLEKNIFSDLVKEAQKKFNVFFDLENDSPIKNKERTITIPQTYWEHTKCQFKCQLCTAGGDWQYPVYYFRCQLISGYVYSIGKYDNNAGLFVFIPNITQGNGHLITKDNIKYYAPDDDSKTDYNSLRSEKKCWDSLNEYLTNLVNLEIERVNSDKKGEPTMS